MRAFIVIANPEDWTEIRNKLLQFQETQTVVCFRHQNASFSSWYSFSHIIHVIRIKKKPHNYIWQNYGKFYLKKYDLYLITYKIKLVGQKTVETLDKPIPPSKQKIYRFTFCKIFIFSVKLMQVSQQWLITTQCFIIRLIWSQWEWKSLGVVKWGRGTVKTSVFSLTLC